MRVGRLLGRPLRWLGFTLMLLGALAVAAFGVLQTSIGLGWAGQMLAARLSSPDALLTLHDLEGSFPFDMRARRIEIGDRRGVWLTLNETHLRLSTYDLLALRLHITALTIGEVAATRLPEPTRPTESVPLSERLRLPRPPVAVSVDRLAVERLALGAAILGEPLMAAIDGRAVSQAGTTEMILDLRRTDAVPGSLALDLRVSGAEPRLAVRLTTNEPTGLLLDRWLERTDRPALAASLSGDGPLSDWHGRFEASAGPLAKLAADITLAATRTTVLTVKGTAAIAPLLPPDLAGLTGDSMPIEARATIGENGAISLDALSLDMAVGRLNAELAFAGADRAIAGRVTLSLPDLAPARRPFGQAARGAADVTATISGTEDRPKLQIDATGTAIGIAGSGADHADARISVAWTDSSSRPSAQLVIAAAGQFRGIAMPDGTPSGLGRDLSWSVAARGARDGSAFEVSKFAAHGAGVEIAGSAKTERFWQEIEGRLRLSIADLRPFAAILGRSIEGQLTLNATAQRQSAAGVVATIDGAIEGVRIGLPAIDALGGRSIAISGSARRDPSGLLRLDRLTIDGAQSTATAAGDFDPTTRQLAATIDTEIRDLRPLGAALDTKLLGQISGRLTVAGALDAPQVHARLDGRAIEAGAAAFDRVRLDAQIADASQRRAAITGDFRAGSLAGTLSLDADASNAPELAISRLHLKAAESVVAADLRIDLATLLTRGSIAARVPELAPWSRLTGTPLAGRLEIAARLDARAGQNLELTVTGDRLSSGAGGSRIAIGHAAGTARLGDLLGAPNGTARATLTGVAFASGGLTSATVTLDSARPGRFNFGAEAKGRFIEPLAVSLEGTADIAPKTGAIDVRMSRLSGALGADRFQLTRPLGLTRHGDDLALSGLALAFGAGRVTGNAARRGGALSVDLTARSLPVAAAARLAGYRDVSGTAAFDLNIGGTIATPQGRFNASGRALRFALPKQQQRLPTLGLDVGGTWNGRELALDGRVSGIKGDTLELSGSAPLVLTPALSIVVPPQGRLALRLQGSGDIGNLADLLPLGEDRFTGRFKLDGSVNGTPTAPVASGRLTITDGRYENFATGAVLTGMQIELAGDRDRLTLRKFTAGDTAKGSLAARGGMVLSGAGPTADLAVILSGFRVLARDEAVATASGTVTIAGAVASPKVTARLTSDQGELSIPDSLPPSVTRLQVVEVNSRAPPRAAPAPAKSSPPALAASLDIRIAVPGRIFVRGRGLDSEWRGQIGVTGTSDAPNIVGSLEASRGTFDFLGKTFKIARGNIGFDGGATIDPALDIVAEIAAADITAQVLVTGHASAPKIAMTSTPAVPQDEILSRVLFNRAVGQITAAEGIQVAQAAATLAGGGPGVLDRLRGRLGLDRLVFGSAPSGMASSSLNPAAGGSAASATAISGGKYVADGVYVGATQGVTPQSSKVIVEIEVRPRVTVQGDFSQSGGSGIGLNYKYDY